MKNTNNIIGKSIPLVNLSNQYFQIKTEVDAAILKVLSSNKYILGSEVENFEKEFAEYIGVKYAIGVASGTDALTVSLKALGIQNGDGVIIPANVYPTSFGVALSGARLQLADVDHNSLNITLESIQRVADNNTKVIVAVHLYGNPVNLSPILEFAKQKNIYLIEDCAQSTGAVYKGKKVGVYGDLACFSFYPTKNLGGYGDGGAIVTNNQLYAQKVQALRMYGEVERYRSLAVGFNSRLDEIQACILRVKLSYINGWNKRREDIAYRYTMKLLDCPLKIVLKDKNSESANHLFVVLAEDRTRLIAFLEDMGITTGVHYPVPVHLLDAFSNLGYRTGDFPISEDVSKKVLSLPFYPEMTFDDVDFVVDCIKKFYR